MIRNVHFPRNENSWKFLGKVTENIPQIRKVQGKYILNTSLIMATNWMFN